MLSKMFRIDRRGVGSSPATTIPRLALVVGGLAFAFAGCASNNNNSGSGGKQSNGGSSNGGSSGNGGGNGNGGSGSGGSQQSGGSNAGGSNQSGGKAAGGSQNGGNNAGGNGAGGSGNGGSNNGGSNAGGSAAGGSGAGGSSTGNGGAAGSGAGGSTSSGSNPPGWYSTKDWSVSSVDWHGCVWTGVDCKSSCPAGITAVPGSTTSITPADFTAASKEGGPYQVTGSVFNDYNSVALLGFDLGDTPKGDATQCSNSKRSPAGDGPPAVTMPSSATGIAVNWTAAKLPLTFRIQIQGVKGATDATNRWCATIKDAAGPSFVPFTDFNTTCWDNKGSKYNNEPISSVAFLVPGTTTAASPFDITVIGFAPGTSKADAPGPAAACGTKTGTVGSNSLLSDTTKATDASMQRAAVQGKDCKTYIVNNNNWGNKSGTYQQLSYTGNSFKVDASNGTVSGQGVPASFPSIYVGANGNIASGAFNTWSDTGLPKSIGDMKSAQSTFKWGGKTSGDFNVTYDIWFAKAAPAAGGYNDGISGLLMVWLYKPGSRQPIGSVKRQATIGGTDFDVWVGPRGTQSTGTDDSGRPVVSYVAKSTVTNFSADLKAFFDDAVKNGDADKSAGGTSQAFSSSWLLTDVFGGAEIWSGSDGVGLNVNEFTVKIQ